DSQTDSAEKALVERLGRLAGVEPELPAEQCAQVLVDEQRLGGVAFAVESFDQDAVARLAVGLAAYELASGAHCRGELRAADSDSRPTVGLESAAVERVERATLLVEPIGALAREEEASRDEERNLGGGAG